MKTSRLWMALVLGSLSAFGPLSIDMYLPGLPTLTKELQASPSIAQLSLTACLIGLALGQLFVGPLSDVRGRRKPLMIALITYSIASLLCAFSPSIWVLIFLRLIQGASGAAGIVISKASVRDLYSGTELTKFYALLMLVNGAAPILAPIAGGQLLHFVSWRGVFVTLFLIGILMFAIVAFSLQETLPRGRRSKGGMRQTLVTIRQLSTNREFMGFAITQGLVFAGMFAYISGSPFVLQNLYKVTPQMFSVIFAVNGVGIIIASQITGRLAGKIPEYKMLVFGLLLAGFGSLALIMSIVTKMGLIGVTSSLFLVVSSVGIVTTTSFSLAMEKQEKTAGSASAILGVVGFLFGAIAAPLVGIGGSHSSLPMGIVIAFCDIGAIIFFMIIRVRVRNS